MSLVIGDTPEKLGSCLAANAMIVDGKIVTRDDYRALAAQVEALKAAIEKWQATDDSRLLADALAATPQHHLRERDARKARAGYELGAREWCFNASEMAVDIDKAANQYAEQILRGEVE